MRLRVVAEVPDRFEDRIAALPDGWVTASARALVRWAGHAAPTPAAPVLNSEVLPGPLVRLGAAGGPDEALAWGPVILSGADQRWSAADVASIALADLGEGAPRVFDLMLAAAAGDGRQVFAAFRPRKSRALGAPATGYVARSVIVDAIAGRVVQTVDDPPPVSAVWGDGPLVLGFPGRIAVGSVGAGGGDSTSDEIVWQHGDLDGSTAARALANGPGGVLAGTAAGELVRFDGRAERVGKWSAHDGPVTALASSPELSVCASGGRDSIVRLWQDDTLAAELSVGAPVDALALAGDVLAALVGGAGGAGGRLLILESG